MKVFHNVLSKLTIAKQYYGAALQSQFTALRDIFQLPESREKRLLLKQLYISVQHTLDSCIALEVLTPESETMPKEVSLKDDFRHTNEMDELKMKWKKLVSEYMEAFQSSTMEDFDNGLLDNHLNKIRGPKQVDVRSMTSSSKIKISHMASGTGSAFDNDLARFLTSRICKSCVKSVSEFKDMLRSNKETPCQSCDDLWKQVKNRKDVRPELLRCIRPLTFWLFRFALKTWIKRLKRGLLDVSSSDQTVEPEVMEKDARVTLGQVDNCYLSSASHTTDQSNLSCEEHIAGGSGDDNMANSTPQLINAGTDEEFQSSEMMRTPVGERSGGNNREGASALLPMTIAETDIDDTSNTMKQRAEASVGNYSLTSSMPSLTDDDTTSTLNAMVQLD